MDPMTSIALLLVAVVGIVALFAVLRVFTIEKHLSRLVHIAEHQAGLKSNEVFTK